MQEFPPLCNNGSCPLRSAYACKACQRQFYCSKICAKQDWYGQHLKFCGNLIEGKKREREEEEEGKYWQCKGHPEWSFERQVLGEGTYGYVIVACMRDLNDCSYVAKVFKHEDDADVFHKEVRIMGLLSDSGIAPEVYDYFECPGKGKIIIMDRLDGSLAQYPVSKKNENSRDFYLAVFGKIAKLIAKLHADYGIAHRDLFYRNVMFKWPDRFYLIDFGLAKEHAEEADFIRDIELLAKMALYKLSRKDIEELFKPIFPGHTPFTRGDLARSAPASFYSKSL